MLKTEKNTPEVGLAKNANKLCFKVAVFCFSSQDFALRFAAAFATAGCFLGDFIALPFGIAFAAPFAFFWEAHFLAWAFAATFAFAAPFAFAAVIFGVAFGVFLVESPFSWSKNKHSVGF